MDKYSYKTKQRKHQKQKVHERRSKLKAEPTSGGGVNGVLVLSIVFCVVVVDGCE